MLKRWFAFGLAFWSLLFRWNISSRLGICGDLFGILWAQEPPFYLLMALSLLSHIILLTGKVFLGKDHSQFLKAKKSEKRTSKIQEQLVATKNPPKIREQKPTPGKKQPSGKPLKQHNLCLYPKKSRRKQLGIFPLFPVFFLYEDSMATLSLPCWGYGIRALAEQKTKHPKKLFKVVLWVIFSRYLNGF